MRVKRIHDGVCQLDVQVRRRGELLLRVVRCLLLELLRLKELALDHVVDVDELVVIGQVALEEIVQFLDDLPELRP